MENLEAIIEGVLFATGDPVSVERLCEVTNCDRQTLDKALEDLKEKYEKDLSRGIKLIKLDDSYQLCTKPEYYDYISILYKKKSRNALSNAALEVLSIIAYNQPVTRSSVEYIRGVNSDGSLARLVELGFVEEQGRLDAPGRPILFGTTKEFLRCFGLSSVSDLPEVLPDIEGVDENEDLKD